MAIVNSVDVTDVLACARQLFAEYHRHLNNVPAGLADQPLVLAIALGERERLLPMLAEVLKVDGGLLVDASLFSDSIPLSGSLRDLVDLTTAVEQLIADANSLPDAPQLRLVLSPSRVTLEGATQFTSASTSQQALRSLILALFHENLRASTLAAFVYPEDALVRQL